MKYSEIFTNKDAQPDNTDDNLTTNECVTTGNCSQEPPGTPEEHNAIPQAPTHSMDDEIIIYMDDNLVIDKEYIVDEPIADVYGPPPLEYYEPLSWYDEDRIPESEETGKRDTFYWGSSERNDEA